MKQMAILLVGALSFFIVSCNSATTLEIPIETDLVSSVKVDGIVYTLTIPTNVFMVDDTLRGIFEIFNASSRDKEYRFNHQQQHSFQLKTDDGNVALYYPIIVQPAPSSFALSPGTKKTFEIRSLFRDYNGQLIGADSYTLESSLSELQSPSLVLRIWVTQ